MFFTAAHALRKWVKMPLCICRVAESDIKIGMNPVFFFFTKTQQLGKSCLFLFFFNNHQNLTICFCRNTSAFGKCPQWSKGDLVSGQNSLPFHLRGQTCLLFELHLLFSFSPQFHICILFFTFVHCMKPNLFKKMYCVQLVFTPLLCYLLLH